MYLAKTCFLMMRGVKKMDVRENLIFLKVFAIFHTQILLGSTFAPLGTKKPLLVKIFLWKSKGVFWWESWGEKGN